MFNKIKKDGSIVEFDSLKTKSEIGRIGKATGDFGES